MDQRQAERQATLAAQAEWVWPALCISSLWALGLLLNLGWLLSWLGASMLVLTAVVMATAYGFRRSAVGALWVGGGVIAVLGLGMWLAALTVFHLY